MTRAAFATTDAFVFRERNPAPLSNKGDPFFIWCSVWKVVVMHLDFDPLLSKSVCNDVSPRLRSRKRVGSSRCQWDLTSDGFVDFRLCTLVVCC